MNSICGVKPNLRQFQRSSLSEYIGNEMYAYIVKESHGRRFKDYMDMRNYHTMDGAGTWTFTEHGVTTFTLMLEFDKE
jgi:hypothetical protein